MGLSLAWVTCETSNVLLAGGQVIFSRGSPVFAPPSDWICSKWVKQSWRAVKPKQRKKHHSCIVCKLFPGIIREIDKNCIWAASSKFGTYRLCEQRRFRRACASAQSRQNLHCSLIQAVSQEEPSDRKPDPWPLWMAGHAQLKFVMTECSKTQIRLMRPIWW